MTYQVKEIFYSLQGEGANTGRAAVFCRFTGCNLWSGRAEDRANAKCNFCDTDFVGGEKFNKATKLAQDLSNHWPKNAGQKFVILTGGEPSLQVDQPLIAALHELDFKVAIETNGTQNIPDGLDWITVSPKATEKLAITHGDELKLVYPQIDVDPAIFVDLDFEHFFLQAMDGEDQAANLVMAMEYCQEHPSWRLGLQTHKLLNIR